jgi:predicted flavoprotein YhiN
MSSPANPLSELNLEADVLVIGGGPAGTWSAWSAAQSGAKVILVDKGYCCRRKWRMVYPTRS